MITKAFMDDLARMRESAVARKPSPARLCQFDWMASLVVPPPLFLSGVLLLAR